MTKTNKILLSIPSILVLSYMLAFLLTSEFHWLVPTMKVYYTQIVILQALTLIQLIILIRRLWSFKQIDKSIKKEWTWVLMLFSTISSLIFIWLKVDELNEKNENI